MNKASLLFPLWLVSGSALGAQQALYTLSGEGSGGHPGFGHALDAAGDLDGDGVADLVAGAPYEQVAGVTKGKARVYSGANGAQLLPSFSDAAGGHFGFSVAGIGDVDGDGVPDLAVGAPMFGGVGPGGTGYATVRSGADGSELFRRTGEGASDEFGYSVAGAGDVDLDGVPDWAVGATEDHDFNRAAGYVRVFSGATGRLLRAASLSGIGKRFGQSLVDAGDANADGHPELLVGASGASQVQLLSGATALPLWTRSGPAFFGWDVDRAGDADANGVLDLVVGAPSAGRVRVLRLDTGATVFELLGPSGDFFGGAVAGLGDIDFDGHDDLAVGAKWADSPSTPFTGASWAYSSRRRVPVAVHFGHVNGDRAGFALACLGDVDQNGTPELAIGANQEGHGGPGAVGVFQVRPGRWVRPR